MLQSGDMALAGTYSSGTPSITLAQIWGVGNHHRLFAFSQKECYFSKDNVLARPPKY